MVDVHVRARRLTTANLEAMGPPPDGCRYELIDGALYVTSQPHLEHQFAADAACQSLRSWSLASGNGLAVSAPGIIYANDDIVAPDVVWVSKERLRTVLGADGKLHASPELVVEVLSPGSENERRDLEIKLGVYSRQDVQEYWVLDYRARRVLVYRHDGTALRPVATLAGGSLESPLLPGFRVRVEGLFFPATL